MASFLDDAGLVHLWQNIMARLSNKLDKVPGKVLSSNDFTDEYKEILDNLEISGGNGGNAAQPDWNAAEGDEGYIKNRTHWEYVINYIPTVTITIPVRETYAELPTPASEFRVGETYIVKVNNEQYLVTAWEGDGAVCLGNGDIYGGAGKGEDVPFVCDFYSDGTIYFNATTSGQYTISITSEAELKKLEEKFLPDSILNLKDVADQIAGIEIPDELADLTQDASHRLVTDAEKQAWNNKSDFSGDYNDLINKPTIPSVAGLATETYVNNAVAALPTKKYVDDAVSNLVDSAPETLNTLNELSAALGDDPNFATTVANRLGEIETELATKVIQLEGKGLSTNDYTNAEKARLATIASDYVTSSQITELSNQVAAAHSHATTYKGAAFANNLYKFTTNAEGHVTNATAVTKADIVALGIPEDNVDTGATSVEVTGNGNAITGATYDAATRKITLTKDANYTSNIGTITEVTASTSLSGGGTSGSVEIKHTAGSAASKASGLYKIATDATSHVSSLVAVTKNDITALGIPAQDTTYTAMTNDEIDAICVIS